MPITHPGADTQQVGAYEAQPKGGRWLTPEQYALPEFGNLPLQYVRKLVSPGYSRHHCPKVFDERDLKRFSRTRILIYFVRPNIAGEDRPRLVERGA